MLLHDPLRSKECGLAETHQDAEQHCLPSVLYVCDFPPSNLGGGTILMSRLLQEYPGHRITVVAGRAFMRSSPQDGRIDCEHVIFPATNSSGRWGIGRLKTALDWLLIPVLSLFVIWLTWRRRADVIVTVAHGHFFIAAALAARITGTAYVLFVHDDWVFMQTESSYLLRYVASAMFKWVARGAAHVYAVSWKMQEWLSSVYGVASQVQLPACEPHKPEVSAESVSQELRIVFAGIFCAANDDSVRLLGEIIKGNGLKKHGIDSVSLTFYTKPVTDKFKRESGLDHPSIHFRSWVTQTELPRVLASADILFLPYSFVESQRVVVSRSFPSKLANYLASGTPILLVGPNYADVVQYAKQALFAEVVDRNDCEAVASAIARIVRSIPHREMLRTRSLQAFMQNHNIAVQRRDFYGTLYRLSRKTPQAKIMYASSACGE